MIFWAFAGGLTGLTVLLLLRPLAGQRRLQLAITLIIPLASLSLYILLGRPELADKSSKPHLPPVLAGTVARLEAAVKADPNDVFSWQLLGDVYSKLERGKQAVNAYQHALTTAPDNSALQLALARALVQAADGKVTPAAQELFNWQPRDPVSRYYLAEALAQNGEWAAAKRQWEELQAETPPESPLTTLLAARLGEAKQALEQN